MNAPSRRPANHPHNVFERLERRALRGMICDAVSAPFATQVHERKRVRPAGWQIRKVHIASSAAGVLGGERYAGAGKVHRLRSHSPS